MGFLRGCSKNATWNWLFNYSLSHGTLPVDWKTANVVSVFKSGEQTAIDNYRPVSLTSMVVKSLERLIHNHIMSFLSDNKCNLFRLALHGI